MFSAVMRQKVEQKAEQKSIIELLSIRGLSDDEINSQIMSVTDMDKLNEIFKTAALATSLDEIRNILV